MIPMITEERPDIEAFERIYANKPANLLPQLSQFPVAFEAFRPPQHGELFMSRYFDSLFLANDRYVEPRLIVKKPVVPAVHTEESIKALLPRVKVTRPMTIQDAYPGEKDKEDLKRRLASAGLRVIDFRLPVPGDLYIAKCSDKADINGSRTPAEKFWECELTLSNRPRLIVQRIRETTDKLDEFWGPTTTTRKETCQCQ